MKTLTLFFCSLAITAALQAQIPTDGLVAFYPFNGNADDMSGNGNDGTVNGAILTTDRFGQPNCAYSFNGNSDWIYIANSNSLNINGFVPLSICAWTYANSIASGSIFSKWGPGYHEDDQYFLVQDVKYCFALSDEVTFLPSVLNVIINEWVFIVGVYDPSTGLSKIYINGILDNCIALNFSIWNTQQYVEIGRREGSYYFNGKIDDISIYNRALSEDEILTLYHDGEWAIQANIFSVIDDQQICINDSTTFEVKAVGIPPIHYQWQKDAVDIQGATDSILIIPHVQPGDAGEYHCIATNDYGADTSNAASLTVEFANPTFIQGSTNVLKNDIATYSVAIQEGHTYEFMAEGGNKIDGTENSIKVHWVAAGQGFVKLIERSELGCDADTNSLSVNIGSLGIDDQETQNLSVYPNPFTGETTFFYSLTEPAQVILQIYNAYGKLIDIPVNEYQQGRKKQVNWNAENLPPGVYYCRLKTGNHLISKKIIKMN